MSDIDQVAKDRRAAVMGWCSVCGADTRVVGVEEYQCFVECENGHQEELR